VHCYLRGTENWCYRLLKNLPEIEQQIICANLKDEASFPLGDAEFVVAPLARLDSGRFPAPWGALVEAARLPLLALWRLSVLRRARKLDILHAHFSFVGWDYLWLVRRLSLPLVVSFYGFDYEWLPRNQPKWVGRYRVLFREAAVFVTEGEFGRRTLIAMGCPAEKVRVVHLGIEPGSVPVLARLKRPGRLRLLQIAAFTDKKGHDLTVRAFARALEACPDMTLTLVGRDPEGVRQRVQELIEVLGVTGCVTIIDGIPFQELYPFFGAFDVFIHPSRHAASGDSEGGAPVVLLDAQATGMPVISSTHCDIPDEVLHGETGLLAAEGDVEGLARHIARFYLMGDAEYQCFSASARRHVEAQYDVARSAAKLRGIYAEILERGGPRAK
jgi:colanic acid/amylovoran biosynthesis glycosyltransferase